MSYSKEQQWLRLSPMRLLERFKIAQDSSSSGFAGALHEIRTGGKRGHWIWYIFPQIEGLGHSPAARKYAIDGEKEAVEYLKDQELRSRLLIIATAVSEQLTMHGVSLEALMGSEIDVRKIVSSLTLFGRVAKRLYAIEGSEEYRSVFELADDILRVAAFEGYPACKHTLRLLSGSQ